MSNGEEIMFCNVIAQGRHIKEEFEELRKKERVVGVQAYFYFIGGKMVLKKKCNEELKVDIDEKVSIKEIIDRCKTVSGLLHLGITSVDIRRTNKGYHLRMITDCIRLDDMQILMIQGLMGDDFKRGCLNYKRIMRGETNWNVLFTKKWGSDGKVKSIEEGKRIYKL